MSCSAVNCTNRSTQGIRLFRFPAQQDRKKIWINNCRRGQWNPTESARLCEVHFEENQFEKNRIDGWVKLKWDAVPTIFNVPNPPKRVMTTRKSKYKDKEHCLQLAQEVVYSKNEADYHRIYGQLKETKITIVIDYFEKNWHTIKDEWVVYISKYKTLRNRTYNRLECTNQIITQVVTTFCRLDQLFEELDMLIITLSTDRDHAATECFCKTPSLVSKFSYEQQQMLWHLTPFTFDLY